MVDTKVASFSDVKIHIFDTEDNNVIDGELNLYTEKIEHISEDDKIVMKVEDIVRYQEVEYTKDGVDHIGFVLELFGPDYIISTKDSKSEEIIEIIEELKSDTIF